MRSFKHVRAPSAPSFRGPRSSDLRGHAPAFPAWIRQRGALTRVEPLLRPARRRGADQAFTAGGKVLFLQGLPSSPGNVSGGPE